MLNASADLLQHLKMDKHAALVRNAIYKTINVDGIRTGDLGGQNTSMDVVQNILGHIKEDIKTA